MPHGHTYFAKLFADIGSTNDVRAADLPALFWPMAHLCRQRSRPSTSKRSGRTYELKRFLMLLALLPTPAVVHGGTLLLAPAGKCGALPPASSSSQSCVGVYHDTMALCHGHPLTTKRIAQTDCCLRVAVC